MFRIYEQEIMIDIQVIIILILNADSTYFRVLLLTLQISLFPFSIKIMCTINYTKCSEISVLF